MEVNPAPLRLQGSRSTPTSSRKPLRQQTVPLPPLPKRQQSILSPLVKARPKTHIAINTRAASAPTLVPRVNVLRESRLHQTFQYNAKSTARLRSHRVGYAVYGPAHGHPVFVIGGYGCTRMVGIMFEELAFRYGLRMIWPERPGYGLSEECGSQEITALEWADVVIQLANDLHIQQFCIIAQSVGTVFALAIARKYPGYVLGPIYLISPWVSTQAANTFKWTRRLPAPLVAKTISLALDVMWMFTKGGNDSSATLDQAEEEEQVIQDTQRPRKNVRHTMVAFEEDELLASLEDEVFDLPTDFPTHRPLRHFVRPKHMSLYLAMNKRRMSENYSQGQLCDVMVALEKYHLFGFNYADIKIPVSAVWGDKDGLIPPKAIDILATSLHDVRLKILESEGHDLVWKEGVMEWAMRGIAERWRQKNVIVYQTHILKTQKALFNYTDSYHQFDPNKRPLMSTFDGRIREYLVVAIDNFEDNDFAKYFILSHVHSDHMKGLLDCNFNKQIYCTEESARIMPHLVVRHNKQPKYRHLENLLIPVKYNQVVRLDTPEHGIITFQFLPANHCIGAAMVLMEGENGSILYTGDTRAEPRFYEENLSLIKKRRIQNLYMDTTCVRENTERFISKQRSCKLLINLIQTYDTNHHFYIDCWTFGYEECWAQVYDTFQKKIHVSRQRYDAYVGANPIYKEYLTTDPSNTRFHSCDWNQDCEKNEHGLVVVHFKPNMDDQPRVYYPSDKSNQLLSTDLRYDCKPQFRHILPFSFHSSLEEVVGFINFVNAKTLTMCVARRGYAGMNDMRTLLRSRGCKLGEVEHSSDYSTNESSAGHIKRRRTSTGSSSFKKVMSNTAEDPDEHTPDGSGSTSSWISRKTGSQPVASKSKLDSIHEEESSHSSVQSRTSSKSLPKSSSQPPLIDRTNLAQTSIHEGTEEKAQSVEERLHIVEERAHIVEERAHIVEERTHIVEEDAETITEEHTASLERSLSWEIVAIVPNTPPPPSSPKPPQDDVIVISSDDEDTKPIMTKLEKRRFFRALKSCHLQYEEYIAKTRAKPLSNSTTNSTTTRH